MAITAGFFPHLQVLIWLPIESSLVERSQSIQSFVVLLLVCLFIEVNSFVKVFVDDCSFLVQDTGDPFGVWKLFDQLFGDVAVGAQGNGSH